MSSLGGFGQGFANGLQAGSEHLAARARMQAVQQEQIDQKLEYYNSATQAVIKNIQEVISSAPQRTPELEQTVAAMRAHAEDTIKGISQFGDKGRVLSMALGNSLTQAAQTPTLAEATSHKLEGELQGKMSFVDQQTAPQGAPQAAPQMAPQPGQPQPGVPQQPAPASQPMMLGSSPAQQGAPGGQGQGESPEQTAQAVQQYAQAQPQPQAQPGMDRQALRQRAMESVFPPTDEEKQLNQEKAKQKMKDFVKVREGVEGTNRSEQALEMLDSGMFAGGLADWKVFLAKQVKGTLGKGAIPQEWQDAINNTEEFEKLMTEAANRILTAGTYGTGTSITEEDRKAAKRVVGGDINLDPESIRRILTGDIEVARNRAKEWNKTAPSDLQVPIKPSSRPDKDGYYETGKPGVRIKPLGQ